MLRKLFPGFFAAALILLFVGSTALVTSAEEPVTGQPMAPLEMPMSSPATDESAMHESPTMSDMSMASMMMMPPKGNEPWYKSIDISGLVDIYYSYNFNRPNSESNQGNIRARYFDAKENQFQVSLVDLVIQKPPTPAGFRVDLGFGPATSLIHDHENTGCAISLGTACAADLNASEGKYTFQNILQAYISWDAPIGRGLMIDVGKFESHTMLEMTQTNLNWNYSHSFIYTFGVPMFGVGVRAGYPIMDTLAIHGYFVNGWDNDTEFCTLSATVCQNDPGAARNRSKTFGYRIAWNPMPRLVINQNWLGGVEGTNGGNAWRNLWDTNATYLATNQLSFMVDFIYGTEPYGVVATVPPSGPPGGPHYQWSGVAGYARYAVNNWYAFSPRLEWFQDNGGLRTGAVHHVQGSSKTLYEVTLTNEFKITRDLIVRLEYRRDMLANAIKPAAAPQNTQNVFEDNNGDFTKGHQDTMLVGVLYTF